jgi:hypothetical protein
MSAEPELWANSVTDPTAAIAAAKKTLTDQPISDLQSVGMTNR